MFGVGLCTFYNAHINVEKYHGEERYMTYRLPLRTYLYFLAQSVNLTTAVMSVSMAALVGAALAPEPWMSTVPYGFQFLFVMLFTYPASRVMSLIGRKKSFLIATVPLAISGITGFIAVEQGWFFLLIAAHSFLGVYIAFANFNRFAATDGIASELKPRAISLVVAGGVLAAIIGPFLTYHLKDFGTFQAFAACYGAFVGLAVISLVLNLLVKERLDCSRQLLGTTTPKPFVRQVLHNNVIVLAIVIAAIGYGLMNLLMIQSSLYMSTIHVHFSDISAAIQWHVLAMFAPSFITGFLIQRLGTRVMVVSGILLLILCSIINIVSHSYQALTISLIALGLGWNFTYVGGSALLTQALETNPEFSVKVQGLNDLAIAIMATLGAFSPAFLLAWLGWGGTNIMSIVMCVLLLVSSVIILNQPGVVTGERATPK